MNLSSAKTALCTIPFRPNVSKEVVLTAKSMQLIFRERDLYENVLQHSLLEQKIEKLLELATKENRWEPIALASKVVQECLNAFTCRETEQIEGITTTAGEMELENAVKSDEKLIPPNAAQCLLSQEILEGVIARAIMDNLEHWEPRVRVEIGKLLGSLARWNFEWVFSTFSQVIIDSIVCNMQRSPDFEEVDAEDDNISINGMESLPSTPKTPSTPHRLDDVSGWKALETSLCAWKFIIEGNGKMFLRESDSQQIDWPFQYLTAPLFDLLTKQSVFHVNRHVRVVGLDIVSVLCNAATLECLCQVGKFTQKLCECIVRGLQDNWSQVRYAASISVRAFLFKLSLKDREEYYPIIVPRLCFNRYYVAERVQKHSQETWQLVMGDQGRQIVAKYADYIVDYYVEMTNHCVREAACHCIAELVSKVDPDAIRKHAQRLMVALLTCFRDSSWIVRDAACLSTGKFVLGFPEESRPYLEELFALWFDHLSDEIWSVREDAAIALGNVIQAYGVEALDRVKSITEEYLTLARKQAPMSQTEYDDILRSEKKHRSKQAFSCCSLEPKFLERPEKRPKALWEHTDGAIYLVRELCVLAPEVAVGFLPQIADVAILRHFPQTVTLQETIWKQLVLMAKSLGKKVFKQYLELFFDPLVFTLEGSNRLARSAAQNCICQLNDLIAPTIFIGRLRVNPVWYKVIAPIANPGIDIPS
uniref:Uncharacterized protein AlNc14C206G8807 n=1 Tax=Albugo laibachii Nc14 TaxID=890382 RepID=F0WQZ9_9STRA|nr:conserved hypothetical protein [Albugo laibachii Nc14]|eukprot:CCA23759.1 conserved hypothetical protein [Albugo laibachii Nc14]